MCERSSVNLAQLLRLSANFIHFFYFIYVGKISVSTHVKITRHWKSTHRVISPLCAYEYLHI